MNRFNNITKPLMWFMALLLTAFMAGCGGGSSSSTSVPSLLNSPKAIDTFSLAWTARAPGGTITGNIDQTMKTITVPVPHRANITQLFATFTTSPGVTVTVGSVTQDSGHTQNDYSLPVSYDVTAADGTMATYTVIVNRDQTVTSLAVAPATASTPKGAPYQFAANATYLDASIDDVTATASWTSADSGVASVQTMGDTKPGLATGLAVGTSVITAAFSGQTATADLTVNNAALLSLAITPASGVVAVGSTKQFTATGTYTDGSNPDVTTMANWTADSSGHATVGLNTGAASGVTASATPVVITATIGTVSNTAQLTVTAPAGPAPVNLLTAGNYVIFSDTAIANPGAAGSITGDIATGPGVTSTAITGFSLSVDTTGDFSTSVPPTLVVGKVYAFDYKGAGAGGLGTTPTAVTTASTDMLTAYNDAAGRPTPDFTELYTGDISGKTLVPGLYKWSTNVAINTDVTLSGSATDVWIFQISGDLNVAALGSLSAGAHVILGGAAKASNVFWQVGGPTGATLGTYSTFEGNILSAKQIIMGTGAVLNGRALAQTAVHMDANTVTQPAP